MPSTRRILAGAVAVAALALAGPAAAHADSRYSGPSGSGTACTEQAPCSFQTALTLSQAGADIVLLPGDYAVGFPFVVNGGRVLRGRDGAARTRIALTGAAEVTGARLADVTISGTVAGSGTLLLTGSGGTAERVVLRAGGSSGGSSALQLLPGGLVRDSVIWSSGTSYGLYFIGFSSATLRAEARNVSVVTTAAGSSALRMNLPNVGDPTQYVGRVRNSIFRGVTKDLDVVGAGNQELQIGTSDFRLAFSPLNADVVGLGGNIEGAPQLFDQSGGDLHQFPASPTIDKGVLDTFTGPSDLDGQPRAIGDAPDIGADEQPGPFPSPGSPPAGNLLVNGDAEAGPGAPDAAAKVAVPGWSTTLGFTAVRYGAPGGFPDGAEGTRIGGGGNFFAGGPLTDLATASQTVDVSRLAADIDAGRATAGLSGDLGGWGSQSDATDVTATFRGASGASLGSLAIGPVSPVDRGGGVLLLRRSTSRPAPAGTRSIEVVVRAVNGASVVSYDDGYADNLALTLTTPPAPGAGATAGADRTAPAIGAVRLSRRAFRRNTSARARRPRSTQLSFTLSEGASLRIAAERRASGARVKGRCLAPTRKRRRPRCTRWVAKGSITAQGAAGANRVAVTGIVGGRALSAGTYRLVITATDAAGNAARATSATLTLKP